MKLNQIEAWALRVIERTAHNQPIEDARVELKSDWPADSVKAARQIAGHANAARGEPILWMIGIDENKGIVGANSEEMADWYSKVKSHFDGIAPLITNLSIPVEDKTVVALFFETDRSPFVVKNPTHGQPNGGPVQWETPWRENNSIRTATRSDLIKLLMPIQQIPVFEVMDGSLSVGPTNTKNDLKGDLELLWQFFLKLYVIPKSELKMVIPFHHCEALLARPNPAHQISFNEITLEPPSRMMIIPGERLGMSSEVDSLTIQGTSTEVLIHGPGIVELRVDTKSPIENYFEHDADAIISFRPVDLERQISISVTMHLVAPEKYEMGEMARWTFSRQTS